MTEIKELTKIQWEILSRMNNSEWCYWFKHFDYLNLTKKELSKEFKILREAGLVYYSRGLMTEEGEVAGSGYGKEDKEIVERLIENWEEKNLPTWEEATKGNTQ